MLLNRCRILKDNGILYNDMGEIEKLLFFTQNQIKKQWKHIK